MGGAAAAAAAAAAAEVAALADIAGTLPPGLRAVAEDPERTLVIHARLGDMSAMAWQEAQANAGAGHDGVWDGGRGGEGWQWVPERFPGYRYPKFPDCNHLREEAEYGKGGGGEEMLEALEWDAARLGGFVVSPLSFYEAILSAGYAAAAGVAADAGKKWGRIVVLTEACSADHPIVRALVKAHGAVVQAGSTVEDLATMVLARHLVISSSTFSLMGALLGRARRVHIPHAGSFSLRSAHNSQCLTPSARLDGRVVYHDVYRKAVDGIAAALGGGSSSSSSSSSSRRSRWMWRVEGKGDLPVRPAACPPSLENRTTPLGGTSSSGSGVPYTFLTWAELATFYRNPACASYYFPPRTAEETAEVAAYMRQRPGRHPICTDSEWTLYTGASKE